MLAPVEIDFIRHALGLDRRNVGFRNFYAAGTGADRAVGRALVAKGLAIELKPTESYPDSRFLIATAGFKAVARPGEKMDAEEEDMMRRVDSRAFANDNRTSQ